MAIAIILSNVIMPVGSAFADGGQQQNNGTYQPVWCKWTGNHWTVKQGQSGGANSWALLMTDAIRALGLNNVDTSIANGQQVMEHDRSDKIDGSYCQNQFTLAIPTPTITVVCGPNNDTVTVTSSQNYTSSFSGWHNGGGTVTITANTPYVFTDGKTKEVLPVTDQNTSCVTTITQLPKSTVTGVCGLNNDTITVGIATNQYYAGVISQVFTSGVAKVTYTAKPGFVFPGNTATYVETVAEANTANCIVKDASASVTVTDPTCVANGIASIDTIKTAHASLTSNGGILSQTVGMHQAIFTADAGHAFANGDTTLVVTYTIARQLTGRQCAGPQPKDDHETRVVSDEPDCLPGGGGTVTSWTEGRSRSYYFSDKTNSWVAGSWSNWAKVPHSETTRPATNTECPKPVQVQPDCDSLGSLTLPAYKGDRHHDYKYVVTIGLKTTTYSADHSVTITGIAQGAKVLVKLVSDDCFHTVIYTKLYCFEYANCIAIPEKPSQNDPCGPNNAAWIVPANTNTIHWSINKDDHLIATAIGSQFTNGQTMIDFGIAIDSNTPCTVTPAEPTTYNDECYLDQDSIYINPVEHVVYYVNGVEKTGSVPYTGTPLVVTAVATDDYTLSGYTGPWTFDGSTFTNKQCLTIAKSAVVANDTNKNGVIDAGDTITWTITVTNNSDNEMDNFYVTINDPNATLENNGLIGSLASGESTTLTATSTITRDQMLICKATNTASFNAWRINREDFSDRSVQSESEVAPLATGSADATYTWTCGGKGAETPTPTPTTPVATQLPETGPQSSVNYLLFGLIAAVTIYGAIYFAQPKKLY